LLSFSATLIAVVTDPTSVPKNSQVEVANIFPENSVFLCQKVTSAMQQKFQRQ
jgi:hypothetical protein